MSQNIRHDVPNEISYSSKNFNDLLIILILFTVFTVSFILQVRGNTCLIPINGGIEVPQTCFFKNTTGHNCPTCGMSRSFVSISHFDFYGAIKYNYGGILAYILCLVQIIYRLFNFFCISNHPAVKYIKLFNKIMIPILIVLILYNWSHSFWEK